jgi:hypothetical protein
MTRETYDIPEYNLPTLQHKIDKLSRRAVKLESSPITLTIVSDRIVEHDNGYATRVYTVEIDGSAPKLNGWRFIAKLELLDAGNIVRALPHETVPEKYRDADPWCDHCNLNRRRKDTYIVAHDSGEYKQVGSSCLADFTGSKDPHTAAMIAEMILTAMDDASDSEEYDSDRGSSGDGYFRLDKYLAYVSMEIRENGWVSRGKVYDGLAQIATCDSAAYAMTRTINHVKPESHDVSLAKSAIEWVKSDIASRDTLSEYEHNLVVIVENEYIKYDLIGYAASIVSSYNREQSRTDTQSEYVGTIGQRGPFKGLTLVGINSFEGYYGPSHLHRFVSERGNVVVWFSSRVLLEKGKVYEGKATIKKHDEYKGVKQTVINRAKFTVMGE